MLSCVWLDRVLGSVYDGGYGNTRTPSLDSASAPTLPNLSVLLSSGPGPLGTHPRTSRVTVIASSSSTRPRSTTSAASPRKNGSPNPACRP